ncbi:MAG TPA: hypothetical protein VGE39_13300 [Prosthecobacter sp.]
MVTELAGEIAQPLLPYPDWKRPAPATVPPADPLVRDLLRFLADPVAESHHIRRVQSDRSHVEAYVQRHELDLDLTTVRKGTPHTLVCRKNSHSYLRALKQRATDEALVKELTKCLG